MCGFGGIFRPAGLGEVDLAALEAMRHRLHHRGPDGHGSWTDRAAGIGLTHTRLAIIDLSDAGAQPMASASGRYVLSYNGEIYNYEALRKRLEEAGCAPEWRGHSDTEVLLAAVEAWGFEETFKAARGMFALAFWDKATRQLTLARDAMGEKPLYVSQLADGGVVFGSELKGLQAHDDFDQSLDPDAIALCIRHGYIPAPRTVFRSTEKLSPGSFRTYELGSDGALQAAQTTYFDLVDEAGQATRSPFRGSVGEATRTLDELLAQSVEGQMVSDVPLGTFLSGGVDSSTVTALMQAKSDRSVQTFALGFEEDEENEAEHAKAIAHHLGTDHHEIILTAEDARDLVALMPSVYDEPFADPSQLPTYLVAQFARRHVTVCLSGDGADELFAGYGRYHAVQKRWQPGIRGPVQRSLESAYLATIGGAASAAKSLGFQRLGQRDLSVASLRMQAKHARVSQPTPLDAFERGFTHLDAAHHLVVGARQSSPKLVDRIANVDGLSTLDQVTLLDMGRYLPDDILVKVDRAAMAHSLETRIPFLNVDVVRFALSLPDNVTLAGGQRKGIVKSVLSRYVPRDLWDRPKHGFGIPVAKWLHGAFRPLAEASFSPSALARDGVLEPDLVQRIWHDFLAGNDRLKTLVWTLLVIQMTLQSIRDEIPAEK